MVKLGETVLFGLLDVLFVASWTVWLGDRGLMFFWGPLLVGFRRCMEGLGGFGARWMFTHSGFEPLTP